jgi:hypothetical protein
VVKKGDFIHNVNIGKKIKVRFDCNSKFHLIGIYISVLMDHNILLVEYVLELKGNYVTERKTPFILLTLVLAHTIAVIAK